MDNIKEAFLSWFSGAGSHILDTTIRAVLSLLVGILLIKALCGLGRLVSNVNIPNTGHQIANLPEGAVVETNAIFERDAIRPVLAGNIPEQVRQLIMPHINNHDRIMKVALGGNKDTELVVEAFLNDPLVQGRASEEDVRKLVKDMMAATLGA